MAQASTIRVIEQTHDGILIYQPPYWPFAIGFLIAAAVIAVFFFFFLGMVSVRPPLRFAGFVLALPFLFFGVKAALSQMFVQVSLPDHTLSIPVSYTHLFAPPPASELNPTVNAALSQAIHKAMAKQPWHRYSSAREFGETLQKAVRNEPIEIFNPARIRPRVQRATEYYEMGDLQFASEILGELEAEGHLDPAIADLRRQIEAKMRERKIRQLLESSRSRMDEDEYPLALSKIEEVLQLDAQNPEALSLKSTIENRRVERDLNDWFRLAQQHIEAKQYSHARGALQRVLQLRPKEVRATQLLSEVDRLERDYIRLKQEKDQNYRAALEAEGRGEISSALSKLERVLELDRLAPETTSPGQTTNYQTLYNKVRSESEAIKDAYAEAQQHLEGHNFQAALSICVAQIEKYPGNALFQALKFDIEEQQRQTCLLYTSLH